MSNEVEPQVIDRVKEIVVGFGDKYFDDKGDLKRYSLITDLRNYDIDLMSAFIGDEFISSHYTMNIADKTIFLKDKFEEMLQYQSMWIGSYTKFENKIGLTVGGKFIDESEDVVLDFPYKDSVLKAGMTKEDRNKDDLAAIEPFLNEIIAKAEIDTLLDEKVFHNVKKCTVNGEEDVFNFTDEDNLIIQGNNLIALHSIKERYAGKIKCIYIDPPYFFHTTKSEDTFTYNSNFKLSTWLTFMKNRLEVAKSLLTDDGAIFVQISDDGVAELHLLLKEIFGHENFINKITLKTKSPSGFASVNAGVFETAEYILSFAKNKTQWKYNPQHVKSEYDSNYKWVVSKKDKPSWEWEIETISKVVSNDNGYDSDSQAKEQLGEETFNALIAEYALNNSDKVFRFTAIGDKAGQKVVEARDISKGKRDEIIEVHRDGQYTVYVRNGQEMAFYSKKVREIDGVLTPSMQLSNIWTDTPYEGIASEGGVKLKGGKKPEKLIKRIIELSTDPGDLVMDFFLGSGTTAAVAHKIGRKYIGCEQLGTHIEMILDRMKGVINGDKTGISKGSNWQGGGSFVYAKLMEKNRGYIDSVLRAKDENELRSVYKRMSDEENGADFDFRVDLQKHVDTEFWLRPIDKQKQLLVKIIDKNQLYFEYSEIDDNNVSCLLTDAEISFNKSFYTQGEK